MEVKGIAVKSIPEFVKRKFPNEFEEWLASLSNKSKKIMEGDILVSSWLPLYEAMVEPTEKICELFYGGDKKGAWEAGRFSSDIGLRGVYKIFVRVGTPHFIIGRASIIFSAYYRPSKLEVVEKKPKSALLHIVEFPEPNELVEQRIGGWMERAVEISGVEVISVRITKSLAKGDPYTEFAGEWK